MSIHDATWTLLILLYATVLMGGWVICSLVSDYFRARNSVCAWIYDERYLTFAERAYVGAVLWNGRAKKWPTPVPQALPE